MECIKCTKEECRTSACSGNGGDRSIVIPKTDPSNPSADLYHQGLVKQLLFSLHSTYEERDRQENAYKKRQEAENEEEMRRKAEAEYIAETERLEALVKIVESKLYMDKYLFGTRVWVSFPRTEPTTGRKAFIAVESSSSPGEVKVYGRFYARTKKIILPKSSDTEPNINGLYGYSYEIENEADADAVITHLRIHFSLNAARTGAKLAYDGSVSGTRYTAGLAGKLGSYALESAMGDDCRMWSQQINNVHISEEEREKIAKKLADYCKETYKISSTTLRRTNSDTRIAPGL